MADGNKIHRLVDRTVTATQRTVARLTRKVIRSHHATQAQDGGLGLIVRTPNTAQARIRRLNQAIADIDGAVASRTIQEAGDATKRALEAIHELDDGRRNRHEWSTSGWSATELELLHAHVGARNASHHTSSSVVALQAESGSPDQSLMWDIEPAAIATLRYPDQQTAYNARLAGQEVLPLLKTLALRIEASTP